MVAPVLAGIAIAVAQHNGWSDELTLFIGVLAALVPLILDLIARRALRRFADRKMVQRLAPQITDGRLPRAKELDPASNPRIHTPIRRDIAYVGRDEDPAIDAVLSGSRRVLIAGPSMGGKTRSALEAIVRNYPIHSVWSPSSVDQIRLAVDEGLRLSNTVIILDDLERFAVEGIADVLDALSRENVVVSTIRATEFVRMQPSPDVKPPGWDLVAWFGPPVWLHRWSEPELERARLQLSPDEHRTVSKVGLSAHLGGGPLLQGWVNVVQSSNDAVFALLQFVRDCRAIGLRETRAFDRFPRFASFYGIAETYQEDAAMKELMRPVAPGLAVANKVGDRLVFTDYLDELIASSLEGQPREFWTTAIELADDGELVNIGAARVGPTAVRDDLAVMALSQSAEPLADINLAIIYANTDPVDLDAAESLLRPYSGEMPEAAFYLGVVLEKKNGGPMATSAEAREFYEFAARSGDPSALYNVARYIRDFDAVRDIAREEELLARAVQAGHKLAHVVLGQLFIETGRNDDAIPLLRIAVEQGTAGAAYTLALALLSSSPSEAEEIARSGCTEMELAAVLIELGGPSRAREVLELTNTESRELAENTSHPDVRASLRLRSLLQLGECTEAEASELAAALRARPSELLRVGTDLLKNGMEVTGRETLTRAFELGEREAATVLGHYEREVSYDLDAAERWYEAALDPSDVRTLTVLAAFLYDQRGQRDRPRELWEQAAALPPVPRMEFINAGVVTNLGILALDDGRLAEAEPLLRRGIASGRGHAMTHLARLLLARGGLGNRIRAAYWHRRGIRTIIRNDDQHFFQPSLVAALAPFGAPVTVMRVGDMTAFVIGREEKCEERRSRG